MRTLLPGKAQVLKRPLAEDTLDVSVLFRLPPPEFGPMLDSGKPYRTFASRNHSRSYSVSMGEMKRRLGVETFEGFGEKTFTFPG